MKISNFLKTVIIENVKKELVVEISDKTKKDVLDILLPQATSKEDTPEKIMKLINSFEAYQQALPIEKRDIKKYTLAELKKLIESKEVRKTLEVEFLHFKKQGENISDTVLRRNVKKFYEIKSLLPEGEQDIKNYDYLELDRFLSENYFRLLQKKYVPIFKKEEPNTPNETFIAYLQNYLEIYDEIPVREKPINFMTFYELEHLVDGIAAKKDVGDEKIEKEFADVEVLYNQNKQVILYPKTKTNCINYSRGRGWCITWPGSQNRYYRYRLDEGRTIYYTIDEDLPYTDLNHILVILVGNDGRKYCADKSNSGRFAGMTPMPWSEIVEKQPKLEGLENIFVPIALTEKENEILNTIRNKKIGDDPTKDFKSPEMLEIWVELQQTDISDIQYSNLPSNLQKKYIANGFELNANKLGASEESVLLYYAKKHMQKLEKKSLSSINANDIALLNIPALKGMKNKLREQFLKEINLSQTTSNFTIKFPDSTISKYISLFGLQDILNKIPQDIITFKFMNTQNDSLAIDFTGTLGKLTNLRTLTLENCIEKLPDEVMNLTELQFLNLPKNKNLNHLPPIEKLPNLNYVFLGGTAAINNLSKEFLQKFDRDAAGGFGID